MVRWVTEKSIYTFQVMRFGNTKCISDCTIADASEHESFKMRQLNRIYSEFQSAGAL
jgi:hypothetical protein